jgi:3-deoxy-D-manno-octulosonic-acid transferase
VVMAAATREGEETLLLQAWASAISEMKSQGLVAPLLLLVPRHPQRFDEVAALVQASGLTWQRRSSWAAVPPLDANTCDVWLGDSLGEMPLYYAMAHVALLGGSFAPLGGQNLIEAAACGCPLLMGPHTFNFAQAADQAVAAGAAQRVADVQAAVQRALQLVQGDNDALQAMAQQALAFAQQHRGAAQRTAQVLVKLLR